MNNPVLAPQSRHQVVAVLARLLLWLVLGAWLVFALAWGSLHVWIVPRIGDFRAQLEAEASKVLAVPVRIGSITAQSTGFIPSFELRDVALLDPAGREALKLPLVLASLSPRSLWRRGFEQLYIDGAVLDVRRAADGKIYVAGLDFSQRQGDPPDRAADWFFSQSEFVVNNATLRWIDEQRGAPPLALDHVSLVLRNSLRGHQMRLDATPPGDWGGAFSVRGLFTRPLLSSHPGRWREWDGRAYADFSRIDVSALRRYADLGAQIVRGNGAARVWADLRRGEVTSASADLALAEVDLRLAPTLTPLDLLSLSGRLDLRLPGDGGFQFSTADLRFRTRAGLDWPSGNLALRHTPATAKAPARGELRADRLDLAALAQIAGSLPLNSATHAQLQAYAPRGLIENLQSNWEGDPSDWRRYQARGRVTGLDVAPDGGGVADRAPRPGVHNLQADFDFNESGGSARVSMVQGAFDAPGIFEDPLIRLDQFSADAQWKLSGKEWEARLSNVKFANADAQGVAQLLWQSRGAQAGGRLEVQGTLSRANGARVYRYLPLAIPRDSRDYVRNAVLAGNASNVRFTLKGDPRDMPFADPRKGEFRIAGDVRNAVFAYVPRSLQPREQLPWPMLMQLSGQLIFERQGMEVRDASARVQGLGGLQFTRINAQIADLGNNPTVVIASEASGPLREALALVNGSPIGAMTSQALAKTTVSGNANYRVRLALPIKSIDKSRVQGTVTLAGNDVQIAPGVPAMSGARGAVSFSEAGFALANLQTRMLGGDLRMEGGGGMRQPAPGAASDFVVQLRGQGTASADGLRQARDLGFSSRLAASMSGSTSYTAALSVRRGISELQINSSLQGLALNLPAPFSKPADSALPLRLESALLRDGAPQKPEDQLSFTLGRVASATFVRDVSASEPRVLRGAISIGLAPGESVVMPEDGVAANVNVPNLDLDAWEKVFSATANTSVAAAAAAPRAAAAATNPALGYLPTAIAMRAGEMRMQGRKLSQVVIGGSREGLTWRANVDAEELNGYVEYRQPSGQGAGRVYARLARLVLASSTAQEVEAVLDEPPTSIPALDVVVEDFDLRGKKLGRLEIEAVNRGAREWRLNKLNLRTPEATFSGGGSWSAPGAANPGPTVRAARSAPERRQTSINFRLDVNDSGELLRRFGMPGVLRRGAGKLEGQVAWAGSPFSFDYPTMNGQFNVNLENGQFLKADPGIAKLLGVLSLQSLPRRLTLDFRDVFSAGFSFDFVRGDVSINQGVAATNNLQMKGVNAAVLMEGSADIARETQDLKVVVVPEINAGTASLIAGVINPAIGLGTFLAQIFLRRPLMQSNTQEFHIDGTWTDPRVTKVPRKTVPESAPEGTKP